MSETAEERVLAVWKNHKFRYNGFSYCLWADHPNAGYVPISEWCGTEELCWEDAASKLPQQNARATAERLPGMDNCLSCDGRGAVGRERMEEACDACLGTGKRSAMPSETTEASKSSQPEIVHRAEENVQAQREPIPQEEKGASVAIGNLIADLRALSSALPFNGESVAYAGKLSDCDSIAINLAAAHPKAEETIDVKRPESYAHNYVWAKYEDHLEQQVRELRQRLEEAHYLLRWGEDSKSEDIQKAYEVSGLEKR